LAVIWRLSAFCFTLSAPLGHFVTKKNKNGRTARFHVKTDYGYRHYQSIKTTSSGKTAFIPAPLAGTDETGL
jgi:hypothetical protein